MDAIILTVGTEILKGATLNTNAQYISTALYAAGFGVREVRSVGDSEDDILRALEEAYRSTAVVIATGGLGPTRDDVTKSAACRFFDRRLVQDDRLMEHLEALFRRFGYSGIPERSLGQALVPEGSTVFPNPRGTACGLLVESGDRLLFLLPGVPVEMRGLIDEEIVPCLARRFNPVERATEIVRTVGIGESTLAERIEEGLTEPEKELLNYYPHGGLVDVVLASPAGREPAATRGEISRVAQHVADRVREYVYGRSGRDLFQVTGDILTTRGQNLAVAESCTGGWLAKTFTDTPGASGFFLSGVVSYSNAAKSVFLGVPESLIATHGAVSEPVCRAMAEGLRERTGATWTLAITGIAGPEGGTPEKPVGSVFIALDGPQGSRVQSLSLTGDREQVRWRATVKAVELLWRSLTAKDK